MRRKGLAVVWLAAVLLTGLRCTQSSSAGSASITPAGLDSLVTSVVKQVDPSVVFIQTGSGLGSGEVYDGQGNIVTNAHVVGSATTFRVTLSDGQLLTAALVGSYPRDDIAVIRVGGSAGDLKPAKFGDSSKLDVGQMVLAIGNPLGLQGSVTSGVVSATGRQVSEGTSTLPDAIQTSAPINPGNSGGALVDLDAQVIGIPTLAALTAGAAGAQAPGIGFAISSNRARFIADQLVKGGAVTNTGRATLGLQAGAAAGASQGVLVTAVDPGGPADRAGIQEGDLIMDVGGQPTPTASALATVLARSNPGQTTDVVIVHPPRTQMQRSVTLGELQ
jgi:S1-C subfamily serine protease